MASCNSTDLLATAYRQGYAKLSDRDLRVAAIAALCSSCNAQPLIELAISDGYLKLSAHEVAMCIAKALCASPGATGAPAPTILALAMQNHLAAMSRRDLDAVVTAVLCARTNPPCITPTAPVLAGLTNSPTDGTILQATWKQLGNAGSLITGYTVFWGTTSGVYTSNSGVLPPQPHQYTITGLTPGTNYFVAVVANTNIAGCQSVNSNERSNSTSGSPPSNTLLQSLTHYWKLDGGVVPYPDSQGTYNITTSGGTAGNAALINEGFTGSAGNLLFTGSGVDATWQFGVGVSLTMQIWFKPAAFNSGFAGQYDGTQAGSAWFLSTDAGGVVTLQVFCSDATNKSVVIGTLNLNQWNQVIAGYDATNKIAFGSVNAGARATVATTADLNQNAATNVGFLRAAAGGNGNGELDEIGWWKGRVLSTANVTTLYNGGAGLPYGSFQP